nr:uncharacterized protein LOC111514940 [Leptinotarsa decemlineata]
MNVLSSRPHVSKVQKEYLFEYLQNNPKLTNPKFSSLFTIKDAQMEWRALASALNRLPGSIKNWKQWRKTWQDMKSKVKMKYTNHEELQSKEEKLIFRISNGFNGNDQPLINEEISDSEEDDNSIDINEITKLDNNDHKQEISPNENDPETIILYVISSDEEQDDPNSNQEVRADCSSAYDNEIIIVGDTDVQKIDGLPHVHKIEDLPHVHKIEDLPHVHKIEGLPHVHKIENLPHVHKMEDLQNPDEEKKKTTVSYYEKKLSCLNRIAKAKERSSRSKARIAKALEKIIASSGDSFI